jgi:hypothetical protein
MRTRDFDLALTCPLCGWCARWRAPMFGHAADSVAMLLEAHMEAQHGGGPESSSALPRRSRASAAGR